MCHSPPFSFSARSSFPFCAIATILAIIPRQVLEFGQLLFPLFSPSLPLERGLCDSSRVKKKLVLQSRNFFRYSIPWKNSNFSRDESFGTTHFHGVFIDVTNVNTRETLICKILCMKLRRLKIVCKN